MARSTYPIDPHLTGIALAHMNMPSDYIADAAAPRRTVDKEIFEWDELASEEFYTIPDLPVGRLSRPNMVDFSGIRRTDSTNDFGIDVPVPQKDVDNADSYQDPRGRAAEGAAELVRLGREKRVADLAFNLNSYLSTQRQTLAGSDQFSDPTSRPLDVIADALDEMIIRANQLWFGQQTWTAFRRHPQIVEAVLGTSAQQGIVSREAVAELFEVERVAVGRGWVNAANPGQTVTYQRLWGKHLSLVYNNNLAQLQGTVMPTFLLTAQFGTPIAGVIEDNDMGLKGGTRVRVGECVKELVISQMCGYFFQNAVA